MYLLAGQFCSPFVALERPGPGSSEFEGRNGGRQIVAILTSDPFLTQADAYMVNISALLILKCVLST